MAIEQLKENVEIIQTLSDYPNTDQRLTPAELKKKFDNGSSIIKEYLNSTVVPAINENSEQLQNQVPLQVIIYVDAGSSSHTPSQILAARSAGRDVFGYPRGVDIEETRLTLMSVTANRAVFVKFSDNSILEKFLVDKDAGVVYYTEHYAVAPLIVTVDQESECANHTLDEIQAHPEAGGDVYLDIDSCLIPLSWIDTNNIAFFERYVPDEKRKVSYLVWDDGTIEKRSTQIATAEDLNVSSATIDKLCPSFSESGISVRCEPVEGYPLSITTEESATAICRCGKNLIDYTQAIPRNANNVVNIIENGIEWESGSYFFVIPCDIKAGETVMFSCVDTASAIATAVLYDRTAKTTCSTQESIGKPLTATADADAIYIYKVNPATEIETSIVLTNLQLECGTVATTYEPYRGIETFAPGETVPALSGVNTIWADSGEITVTGRADPVAIIEKLTAAIISLGGNV